MPIYEYWCLDCKKKNSYFVRSISSPLTPTCKSCGSEKMQRAVSTFSYRRPRELTSYSPSDPNAVLQDLMDNPKNMDKLMEHDWQKAMGEPMPSEYREALETMSSEGSLFGGDGGADDSDSGGGSSSESI